MKKLTYYVATHKYDSRAYSIRTKTHRAAWTQRTLMGQDSYEEPRKVEVEYRDDLDLLQKCFGEGGGAWEMADEELT